MTEPKTLSPSTVKILKSFSMINQSISVTPGNILRTISNSNIILGRAAVEENFEMPFAIYDLSEFMSALSLFEEPEITFNEKVLFIKEKNSEKSIEYRYSDPDIIHTTEKDIKMPETEIQFSIDEKELSRLLKTSAVLQAPHLVVMNSKTPGCVCVMVNDIDNPASNKYSVDIKATAIPDVDFNLVFKVENMIIIPNNYEVEISSKLLSHFKSGDLEYWVALEQVSTFG